MDLGILYVTEMTKCTNFPQNGSDRRLYDAHIKILKYLNTLKSSRLF